MELLNFSAEERTLLQEYLAGLEGRRRGACLPSQVQVIKTNTFATDCEALFAYYPPLGLETLAVRPVFNPDGRHRILVNGELCQGLSLAYNLAQALYQLDRCICALGQLGSRRKEIAP